MYILSVSQLLQWEQKGQGRTERDKLQKLVWWMVTWLRLWLVVRFWMVFEGRNNIIWWQIECRVSERRFTENSHVCGLSKWKDGVDTYTHEKTVRMGQRDGLSTQCSDGFLQSWKLGKTPSHEEPGKEGRAGKGEQEGYLVRWKKSQRQQHPGQTVTIELNAYLTFLKPEKITFLPLGNVQLDIL